METITRVVPATTISAAVEEIGVRERRVRKLSARMTILVLIGMGLYNDLSIQAVMHKLVRGVRLLWPDWEYQLANASALSQRRYQVGVRVVALLFRRVCQPLAQVHTQGDFLFGLRLMALDGTKDDVPDTPENARVFGRPSGPNGGSAYSKVLTVLLSECGTHAVVDADFAPCYGSERDLGRRLLRSIGAGMLLMFDRGFYNFDLILGAGQRGAQVLGRLAAGTRPKPIQGRAYLKGIVSRQGGLPDSSRAHPENRRRCRSYCRRQLAPRSGSQKQGVGRTHPGQRQVCGWGWIDRATTRESTV